MKKLVDGAANSVKYASQGVASASNNIKRNSNQLENSADLIEFKVVLSDVVAETKQLIKISENLKSKLNETNVEMLALRDELSKSKEMASTDGLTGLLKKHGSAHHHSARYGGEEMAVIMPDTELIEALKIAEMIRESLANSQLKQKSSNLSIGKITVSIGVTSYIDGDSVEGFIERADSALYTAKESGRNKVVNM